MNKNDLVYLKQSFSNKNKYTQFIGEDGPLYDALTEQEILEMIDTEAAVNGSITLLKEMITYLSNNDTSYNGIAICPSFSVFVDTNFISEDGNITNKRAILNDYVGISFNYGYFYYRRSGKMLQIDEFEDDSNMRIFYSKLSDFIVGLNECGLELERISNFDDIRQLICENKEPLGKIAVSFKKTNSYSKRKNN